MTKVLRLPLSVIVEDDDNQPRLDRLDGRYIDALAEVPEQWPPISVVNAREGAYVLVDGFHRMEAARRLGLEQIDSAVYALGADQQLRDLAFDLNSRHGRALSLADRCSHAEYLLQRDARLSDREIGRRAGIAAATAARIRRSLEEGAQIEQSPDRVGADGRAYTAPAQDRPLGELPDVSLAETVQNGLARLFTAPEKRELRRTASYLKRLAVALEDQHEIDSWQTTDDAVTACLEVFGKDVARELAAALEPSARNIVDVAQAIRKYK